VRRLGADQVGMMTGDSRSTRRRRSLLHGEVLANIACGDGADGDVGQVVMDDSLLRRPGARLGWQVR